MRVSIGLAKDDAEKRLEQKGVSRRDFMKFCAAVATALGMGPGAAGEVAQVLAASKRPSVIYLHGAECTGCSEAVLRTYKPFIDELILDTISLDYHETIMAAAGEAAEDALHKAMNSPDGFILVHEGAIPTIENGNWGMVGGHTMADNLKACAAKAKAIIAMGTCATFGGVQAAKPNPSQAVSVAKYLDRKDVINIAGCPPNPINFVGAVVLYLKGEKIDLDSLNRPKAFFGTSVHDQCERVKFFDEGKFAPSFDSEEAKKGYCLYNLGCRGPETFNNCPKVLFNDTNWPVKAGHPCIGCSEPSFWDSMSPFYVGR
ncbi:Periplasmic [NiFe] hydrogenase small subunit [Fundidesulfovibrio magnetotacticus]|uniref:cytochrome-c3 hydrogenase n=1 Tax=Fundidesulfovibrio magnetotacticus TaxID=2730080 RepID=A0A6V8LRZ9_9BACT|nr:hydrogenase small subunit [Fundidesulfovibrio magnetotacticus]GFK93098.1 Periplasmic [NiFe] hydrogenase small subunit [Fundidesulfovibrio magnetotacticus]